MGECESSAEFAVAFWRRLSTITIIPSTKTMSRSVSKPTASSDLLDVLAGVARDLRRSFCAMLQDEIDLLAGNVIELNMLCREMAHADVALRLAAVSDSLDGLRAEKVALAARLGCVPVPDPRA